jgi:hypothetical protein
MLAFAEGRVCVSKASAENETQLEHEFHVLMQGKKENKVVNN